MRVQTNRKHVHLNQCRFQECTWILPLRGSSTFTHTNKIWNTRTRGEVKGSLSGMCVSVLLVEMVCLASTFNLNASAAPLKADWISSKAAELLLTNSRAWFNTDELNIWVAVCKREKNMNASQLTRWGYVISANDAAIRVRCLTWFSKTKKTFHLCLHYRSSEQFPSG